ncbi:Uncharacterised protein [Escherichia coli]|nr:Uncharacterised protein [Escherichia coli]
MTQAKLNSEFIATVAGDITVYNYDTRHGNTFHHQQNILPLASVSRHVLV